MTTSERPSQDSHRQHWERKGHSWLPRNYFNHTVRPLKNMPIKASSLVQEKRSDVVHCWEKQEKGEMWGQKGAEELRCKKKITEGETCGGFLRIVGVETENSVVVASCVLHAGHHCLIWAGGKNLNAHKPFLLRWLLLMLFTAYNYILMLKHWFIKDKLCPPERKNKTRLKEENWSRINSWRPTSLVQSETGNF